MKFKVIALTVLGNFVSLLSFSQLALKEIMSGNEFIGFQPEGIHWSPDSKKIYFRWRRNEETVAYYYAYDLVAKKYQKLSGTETWYLPVDGFSTDKSAKAIYFQKANRIYHYSKGTASEVWKSFSPVSIHSVLDESKVLIRQGLNLFLFDRLSGHYTQLTNFVEGNKPPENEPSDTFLEKQQDELFEIVRNQKARAAAYKEFKESHQPEEIKPFYLQGKFLSFVEINDQLNYLIFGLDQYPSDNYTHIESYVTADGYSKSVTARPKVGSEDPKHEVFVWNLVSDSCYQVNLSQLSGIKSKPEFLREYEGETFSPESKSPKGVVYINHSFNDSGNLALLEVKSYDNKDRWILTLNVAQNTLNEIDHQHDDAWIGGPGISSWKSEPGNVGWLSTNQVYFQSEVSGYSHLYLSDLNTEGKAVKTEQLTQGNFEIHEAYLNKNKTQFYVSANKNHPGNREFYILDPMTKSMIPVLTEPGNYEVHVSPDEKWIAVRYSYKNKPWDLYIAPLKENTTLTQITDSRSEAFKKYPWRDPAVISYKASDGAAVYARLYEPSNETKNGAAVMFVHGAGYLQNAHNWWSHYHREYMFHNLLTDLGYTVLDVDYRASEGYGRDFRTGIYRHMGGKDLSDYLDGRELLIENYGIDSSKIGIYGGSYGGFITLMALLTEPGKFKCGAALRAVTDWAHYNHEYTSCILNTPEIDPIAYRRSSPIYFAENLEDRLIMLHGMEDDNVQYQDVVRLSQRFIELGKTNWDLVGYPIEAHAFQESSSWHDEYRRILELMNAEIGQ